MNNVRVVRGDLEAFCGSVFGALGVSVEAALDASRVLVAADARGIASHGVGRLRRYVNGLREGQMDAKARVELVADRGTALVFDAHGGLGAPASVTAMRAVLARAAEVGMAMATVTNSNHNGIAGFYAQMALEHDCVGIAMTNTAALGVPTGGCEVMFGTNPLAFAAPAGREAPFVLDMSTTVVTRGKLEVYDRLEKPLPPGWAVDKNGVVAADARGVLDDMFRRAGGGILQLGGAGTEHSGHKGYGLALMVDILCGLLAGAAFGPGISDTATSSARVSHFFAAGRGQRPRAVRRFAGV
ncbi:MAG: Ldh family oxidoreductase [Spirochaetales bacterium]